MILSTLSLNSCDFALGFPKKSRTNENVFLTYKLMIVSLIPMWNSLPTILQNVFSYPMFEGLMVCADPKGRFWEGTGHGFVEPRSHRQYQPYNTAALASNDGVGGSQVATSHVLRGGSSSVTVETTKQAPPFIDFLGVGAT